MRDRLQLIRHWWRTRGMSEFGRELLDMLGRDSEWAMRGVYSLRHKPTGLELWMGSRNELGKAMHVAELPNISSLHITQDEMKSLLSARDTKILRPLAVNLRVQKDPPLQAVALNAVRLARMNYQDGA